MKKQVSLLVYLRNDPPNTLSGRIAWLQKEKMLPSLEGRDDVLLLSDNVILVDQTSAHGIFVQLCSGLAQGDWPYLLVPMDAEFALGVGKFPEQVRTILSAYDIPLV